MRRERQLPQARRQDHPWQPRPRPVRCTTAKRRTNTRKMTPHTFTQRGAGGGDPFAVVELMGDSLRYIVSTIKCTVSSSNQRVSTPSSCIQKFMPKLWDATIEAHRREVREAIVDSAAAL